MTLTATKYVREIGKGRTTPKIFECDNGHLYVVKAFKKEFTRSLINDWLAYQLGRLIGLSMPKCSIIEVPESLIQSTEPLRKQGVPSGPAFGSYFVENKVKVTPDNLSKCVNKDDLADMFVFDMWINNRDRNQNNLLIDPQYRLLFIDHEKAFCGRNWGIKDLVKFSQDINPKWSKKQKFLVAPLQNKEAFQKSLRLIYSLTRNQIEMAFQTMPQEWGLTEEEKEHLVDFLIKRRTLIEAEINKVIEMHF